jgi:CelD/BcsL family acetyltransferase involved in cellulose biosynthesis
MPILHEIAVLEPLRAEWAALWSRVPDATPFQHPAWLIPWWRHVGEGESCTLALREAGELVALVPLYIWRRRLFPLGIGTTDYLDALALPGHAEAAMAAALGWIAAERGRFDVVEWPQLRPGSPLLLGAAPPGWAERVEPAEACPVLHLPAEVEGLRERVSGKTLRDLRTARRRAAEAGVAVEEVTEETLPAYRAALVALHAARWRTRQEEGVLAAPGVQAMQAESMREMLAAGLLRMFGLRAEGRIVAVVHALADPPGRAARSLYLYLQGFDPGFERISPGLLLVGEACERAVAEGFATLDFLRGQERYKSFWGVQDAPTFRRVLTPPEATA